MSKRQWKMAELCGVRARLCPVRARAWLSRACDWLNRLTSWLALVMDQWIHHRRWRITYIYIYISHMMIELLIHHLNPKIKSTKPIIQPTEPPHPAPRMCPHLSCAFTSSIGSTWWLQEISGCVTPSRVDKNQGAQSTHNINTTHARGVEIERACGWAPPGWRRCVPTDRLTLHVLDYQIFMLRKLWNLEYMKRIFLLQWLGYF
jgi:hypothetical protein